MKKVRWGILSCAHIARKVIPALQKGNYSKVLAISSRSLKRAKEWAQKFGIPHAFGSYEELLQNPDIDAIYNPLPNHLHVPWSIKALQAGKHVLCEKPIALSVSEAQELLRISHDYPRLKIMEAFMYRFHPQWQETRKMVERGAIGDLKTIHSVFTYFNNDPNNIRNKPDIGGGGLMDIGCYCISLARFLFAQEPRKVCGIIDLDPKLKIDRMASGLLVFEKGTATFTCSTQLNYYQRVNVFGTKARIELMIPFNAPPDIKSKIIYQRGSEFKELEFDICDQYTLQGDQFSLAILNNTEIPYPLDDALANLHVLFSLKSSAKQGCWIATTQVPPE